MKHLAAFPLVLSLTALIAAPASAQIFVNSDEGNAYSCYQSAKNGDMGSIHALSTCTEALRDDTSRKTKAATLVNRGVLLMRRGDNDAAVEDYQASLKRMPDLPEAHINYAAALFYLNRDQEALTAINTALELGTEKEAEALYNRALIYDRAGDAKSAYYDLKRVLELKPDWERAQQAIGRYTVTKRSNLAP